MIRLVSTQSIVAAARLWVGTPYRHQASLRGIGCDCLGLLRGVWRDAIGPEPEAPPPYSRNAVGGPDADALLAAALRHLVPRPDGALAPGRVILFRWRDGLPARHCGIASASDAVIHAHEGASVAEIALSPEWRRRVVASFSFPGAVP